MTSTELAEAAASLRAPADADLPHEPTQSFALVRLGRRMATGFGLALALLAQQIADANEDEAIPADRLPFWREIALTLADALDAAATGADALAQLQACASRLSPPTVVH